MKATDVLRQEHVAIKRMLAVMEQICDRLDSGRRVDIEDIHGVMEFISVFIDRCHHAKEEKLLFVEMETAGIPKEAGPIGAMLIEHDMCRKNASAMQAAAKRLAAGEASAAGEFVSAARPYAAILIQHIDKENNALYVMADSALSAQTQQQLLAQFQQLEKDRIGPGQHERLHELLERLDEKYLKKSAA